MQYKIATPYRENGGYRVPMYFTTDSGLYVVRSPLLQGSTTPTQERIEAERVRQEAFVQQEEQRILNTPLQANGNLASLAIAAKAILERSPKLQNPEVLGMLDQLVSGVKNVANADPLDGDAATALVMQMLSDPLMQENKTLCDQIIAALNQIVDMTGGIL